MGLIYKVHLPEVLDVDVVSKKLKASVNGVEEVYELGGDIAEYTLPVVPQGSIVIISVCHIDDAGNESDWSEPYRFDAKDSIRPYMPGPVRVVLMEEVADTVVETPTPEPEPVVEEPVAPEPEPTPEIVAEETKISEDTVDLPPDHPVDFGI